MSIPQKYITFEKDNLAQITQEANQIEWKVGRIVLSWL